MRLKRSILICALGFQSFFVLAQDCNSIVLIRLVNSKGGFFSDQKIIFISRVDGKTYEQRSDDRGEAAFTVPCHEMFDLTISNYPKKIEVESPQQGKDTRTFSYSPGMIELERLAAMTPAEQVTVDEAFKLL